MFAYVDRDGNKLSLDEWAKKLGDRKYCIVKQTTINVVHEGNDIPILVSTVWVGMTPLPFETMVFLDDDAMNSVDTATSEALTEADALDNHERTVAVVELYKDTILQHQPMIGESK